MYLKKIKLNEDLTNKYKVDFECIRSITDIIIKKWEMICLQQFYNIFTTNLKWQVVIGCYCWVKNVISVLNSNLN